MNDAMMVLVFFTDPVSLETLAEIYYRCIQIELRKHNTFFCYNSNTKVLYTIEKSILFAIQSYK